MSSDTLSTTFRLLNHFTSPCATSPSIPQSRPVSWRTARRACALGRASCPLRGDRRRPSRVSGLRPAPPSGPARGRRSEEHTPELQTHHELGCRLLLEKKIG